MHLTSIIATCAAHAVAISYMEVESGITF